MEILELVSAALGLDRAVQDIGVSQMILRACVIYLFTLLIIKAAKKRFMGQNTAFDVVILIILGSVVSRAINGSAPLMPTIAAGIALILVHRLMSWMTFRSRRFARLVEGHATVLMSDGTIDWNQMRKHDITEKDLRSALRLLINSDDLSEAKHIYLEPNGKLSIVRK